MDTRVKRIIEGRKGERGNPYMGLMTMGMVGWSFSFPFVLFMALGVWLDKKFLSANLWTLVFMVVGLIAGFLNVVFWIKKEAKKLKK